MIEKRYSSSEHPQQEPHFPPSDEHSLMCTNCNFDENSNPLTPRSACSYDTRRRPFPTLLYPRLPWNSNGKCQGCMGKEQLDSNVALLDQYATTRMLDLAAEEELEAAQASGDLERIREARTILDFNKKAT